MIASECSPFIKINGISDAIKELAITIKSLGVDIDIVLPYYQEVNQYLEENINLDNQTVANARIGYKDAIYSVDIIKSKIPGTKVNAYFINEPNLISNNNVSDDDKKTMDRLTFFAKATFEVFIKKQLTKKNYDIIHANDWQTGTIIQEAQNSFYYS